MRLANAETERWRQCLGMSRREFVRTSAALAVGFWALDALSDRRFGSYARGHNTGTTDACDLEWAGRQGLEAVSNLPGELIFDVQSHHVDPDGLWRVTNPSMHAFFALAWPQARPGSGGGEADPIQNLSRFHYLKELFLDSATTAAVLSAVPTAPDENQPLPIAEAMETAQMSNDLAGGRRVGVHAFVMPNRGALQSTSANPRFLQEELDLMAERAAAHRDVLAGLEGVLPMGRGPQRQRLDARFGARRASRSSSGCWT